MRPTLLALPLLLLAGCGPLGGCGLPFPDLSQVYQSFRAPSEGMLPTLLAGDNFFVDKQAFADRDPRRGEVVVFELAVSDHGGVYPPDLARSDRRDRFIKRIIGVPGDAISFVSGRLHLNGSEVPLRATDRVVGSKEGRQLPVFEEYIPEGTIELVVDPERSLSSLREILVPPGRYFLLGDNRTNSRDSRSWGTLARVDLVGPVTGVYLSNGLPTWRTVDPRTQADPEAAPD